LLFGKGSKEFEGLTIKGKDEDEWVANLALDVIDRKNPGVLLINFPMIDFVGHITMDYCVIGKALENVDYQIGRVMRSYKELGIYDDTTWVVLSDHGMTPAYHWIDQQNIRNVAGNFITDNPAFYCLGDPQELCQNIVNANIEGIKGAYYKKNNEYFLAENSSIAGVLDDSCQYLLSTEISEFSHDVVLIEKQNWRSDWHKFYSNPVVANHETISWGDQHIILTISGLEVKRGFSDSPASIVDVASTVLKLSGIDPVNMDGIVLSDCMKNVEDVFVVKQNESNKIIKPLLNALREESEKDLDENYKQFDVEER